MPFDLFEKLQKVSLCKGIEVATGVEIEDFLGMLKMFDAFTLTRFITNQSQGMIDHMFDPSSRSRNARVITDGGWESDKIAKARYAANIMPFISGVRTPNQVLDASHQVIVWVSRDYCPHKNFVKLFQEVVGPVNRRVTIEPNQGREKRI